MGTPGLSCLGAGHLRTGCSWTLRLDATPAIFRAISPVFARPQAGICHAVRMADSVHVKTLSPFVPTVCLISVPSRGRPELFKKVSFGLMATSAVFFLGLLITGSHRELVVSAKELPAAPAPPAGPAAVVLAASSAPVQAVPLPPPAASTEAPAPPETVYSVISSDTLSGIARRHGTTVKAIKAANGLSTERLSIGQKLKIP